MGAFLTTAFDLEGEGNRASKIERNEKLTLSHDP